MINDYYVNYQFIDDDDIDQLITEVGHPIN